MIRRITPWLLLAGLFGFWLYGDALFPPEKVHAERAAIRDGDTMLLGDQTIRLYGIDAPEYHQNCKDGNGKDWPCGTAARLQLAALAASGSIICAPQAQDRYGRTVARCSSAGVPDMAAAMTSAGLAVSPAERGTAAYAQEEADARSAKRGIWQGVFQIPAQWRAAHPRAVAPLP